MKNKTEGMEENKCTQSETEVILKAVRRPRFKAGADLSGKMNRVTVDINEESHEDHELIEIRIELFREECEESDCPEC